MSSAVSPSYTVTILTTIVIVMMNRYEWQTDAWASLDKSGSVLIGPERSRRSKTVLVMFKAIGVLQRFAMIFLFVGQSSHNSIGVDIVTVWSGLFMIIFEIWWIIKWDWMKFIETVTKVSSKLT